MIFKSKCYEYNYYDNLFYEMHEGKSLEYIRLWDIWNAFGCTATGYKKNDVNVCMAKI